MAKSKADSQAISSSDIPLLKSYLRETPAYPPHVPTWIPTFGWILFVALALLTVVLPGIDGILPIAAVALLSYLVVVLLRKTYKPKTDTERVDEARFAAIRKMKAMLDDGLHRRLPPEVLAALEDAVEARNLVVAKLNVAESFEMVEAQFRADRMLQACFVAAVPVMRGEECSRGDWQKLLSNRKLILGIVETIESQTELIRNSAGMDRERLAALRELDQEILNESLRSES